MYNSDVQYIVSFINIAIIDDIVSISLSIFLLYIHKQYLSFIRFLHVKVVQISYFCATYIDEFAVKM